MDKIEIIDLYERLPNLRLVDFYYVNANLCCDFFQYYSNKIDFKIF